MDSGYLLTLIIAILTIIITTCLAKWATYSSKENRKKIRFRCNVVLVICIIIIISLFIWQMKTYKKQIYDNKKKMEMEYSNDYKEILFELGNGNYIESLRKIEKLLYSIEDKKEKIELCILKGNHLYEYWID